MHAVAEWPAPVRDYLGSLGPLQGVENLGGMSLGQVWRVRFAGGSVIVKTSPSDREHVLYTTLAGPLGEIGVSTPRLEWSGSYAESHWLVLEDIPDSLPRASGDRWRADRRVLETLCRLHCASLDLFTGLPKLFEPNWTAEMSEAALTLFPPADAGSLSPVLASLRWECQPIFERRCFISGDPNPANWGVREGGSVVLFDWERFGQGTPAIDLAIIIPGLGDGATYQQVARDYRDLWSRMNGSSSWSTQELARDIGIAKAWTVVEFMANHVESNAKATRDVVNWLVRAVPAWLDDIAGGQ